MKKILLIITALAVLTTYSKGQTLLAAGSPTVAFSDDNSFSNSASALEVGDGDQDENPLITFYPNPVRETLNIKFRESGNYVIRIFNVVGTKVAEKRVEDDNFLKMDVSNLAKGMYFLSFEPGNGKVITKTFTKEN